jgi:serine/threonine-protein kinase
MTLRAAVELGPDSVVGPYRLRRELGRGGMATVFEAQHSVLPRQAALKVMHADLRRQPGMATRVVQEATILEDLRHPGVVRVYDCDLLPDHRPWIAMELVEGDTLAHRLARLGSLRASEVAELIASVAEVLASVHARGVVHRDLKPDNLILTPGDREYPLRLIDWGVARLGPIGRITLDGLTPGTPIYMSPEQAAGRHIAPPCDVYSLGVIGYEAITGRPPFDGRTLAEVVCMHLTSEAAPLRERTTAPRALCGLVHRMLDKDPARRPDAREVVRLARAIACDPPVDYESFELALADVGTSPTEEALTLDPDVLEFGVTELVPTLRKPRWTPEVVVLSPRRPITPRGPRDAVAGELLAVRRR